eukprot:CAMPEP_0185324482 /NCGR_PEP_ID=MMETSP1363-20130426/64212_1 /TAXON_ID=38817 /ORGANISM="Gephyrocapsa oceanica, Strain RCC1303" /LENGTH=295 /DNA_ID=CAMNT_0027923137 /DNA_START=375 /DNA_END=1260 /DNA_ORIENTATION=-
MTTPRGAAVAATMALPTARRAQNQLVALLVAHCRPVMLLGDPVVDRLAGRRTVGQKSVPQVEAVERERLVGPESRPNGAHDCGQPIGSVREASECHAPPRQTLPVEEGSAPGAALINGALRAAERPVGLSRGRALGGGSAVVCRHDDERVGEHPSRSQRRGDVANSLIQSRDHPCKRPADGVGDALLVWLDVRRGRLPWRVYSLVCEVQEEPAAAQVVLRDDLYCARGEQVGGILSLQVPRPLRAARTAERSPLVVKVKSAAGHVRVVVLGALIVPVEAAESAEGWCVRCLVETK